MVMDREDKPEERERLLCLHPDTGELRWEKHWPVTYGSMGGYSTGPRTTVLQTAELGYSLGATGRLVCFELETGKVRWELDAVKDLDAVMPQWGYAGSPVLHEGKLLVHLGLRDGKGSVVALDPATGKKLWTGGKDAAGYSAPQPYQKGVIQWGPNQVEAFSTSDGAALWSYPYEITYGVSIAQPLVVGDLAMVSGYWHGTKVFKLSGAREV
jgi:outer membrane protein assembly factor BamB